MLKILLVSPQARVQINLTHTDRTLPDLLCVSAPLR